MEKYLFVSDIHGRKPNFESELRFIAKNDPPKIVFFLGDIVGTDNLDKLQKMFSNDIINPVKDCLKNNPSASDAEILLSPIGDNKNVADGSQKMWSFLHEDSGLILNSRKNIDYIRQLMKYSHSDHFISNLPEKYRQNLQRGMEINSKVWVDIMTEFISHGSTVVIIEGDRDALTPLDFYPTEECQALPVEKRPFYFKNYVKSLNNKILYFDQAGIIETKNEIFVLWPFDYAKSSTQSPKIRNRQNKKVILISHGQVDWKSIKGSTYMTKENEEIQLSLGEAIHKLQPDAIIHGHLHSAGNNYFYKNIIVYYLPIRSYRYIEF